MNRLNKYFKSDKEMNLRAAMCGCELFRVFIQRHAKSQRVLASGERNTGLSNVIYKPPEMHGKSRNLY